MGEEQLDGEVFLRLVVVSIFVSTMRDVSLRTISTVPLPDSLTVRGKGASKPDASFRTRNAWCGRLALEPSLVVTATLTVSPWPSVTIVLAFSLSVNLQQDLRERLAPK